MSKQRLWSTRFGQTHKLTISRHPTIIKSGQALGFKWGAPGSTFGYNCSVDVTIPYGVNGSDEVRMGFIKRDFPSCKGVRPPRMVDNCKLRISGPIVHGECLYTLLLFLHVSIPTFLCKSMIITTMCHFIW